MIYQIFDQNGNLENTIVADQEFVEKNYYGRYMLVGPEPEPQIPPIITKIAFRFRFTNSEYAAILSAAKTDVDVQAWYETFNMIMAVDLNSQYTKQGIEILVSKNLLTQARADEILTAPVQPNERA
jgi:hypothetical protein